MKSFFNEKIIKNIFSSRKSYLYLIMYFILSLFTHYNWTFYLFRENNDFVLEKLTITIIFGLLILFKACQELRDGVSVTKDSGHFGIKSNVNPLIKVGSRARLNGLLLLLASIFLLFWEYLLL